MRKQTILGETILALAVSAPALAFAAVAAGAGSNTAGTPAPGITATPTAPAIGPGTSAVAPSATPMVSPTGESNVASDAENRRGVEIGLGDTLYGAGGQTLGSIARLNVANSGAIDSLLVRVENGGGTLRMLPANAIGMRNGQITANLSVADLSRQPEG